MEYSGIVYRIRDQLPRRVYNLDAHDFEYATT
jgi:hypothetical protein